MIDAAENVDIIFWSDAARDNGVIVVNEFFECSYRERRSSELFQFFSLFLVAFFVRFKD